jgi:hypothetical protein
MAGGGPYDRARRMDLRFVIELRGRHDVDREWANLSCGGAFVRGARADTNLACTLVLIGASGATLELPARTVHGSAEGIGVAIDGFDPAMRDRIHAWLATATATATTADAGEDGDADDADDADRVVRPPADPVARNVFERLRRLTVVQQLKVAREGEVHERMALERIYGKTVWEALLRNPRVTHPEVTRIARMGALPRPLLELIVGNTAWLRVPEIRRALLGNLRLTADMIPRVLRLVPKHELRLVPIQTAYPAAVRDAARRMLRDGDPAP